MASHQPDNNADTAQGVLTASLADFSIEMSRHESAALRKLAHRLPAGTDVFLNVLHGDSLEDRLDVCRQLRELGLTPVPHVAARNKRGKDDVRRRLEQFTQEAGVRDFLIIAGDVAEPAGEIRDALDFIRAIGSNDFGIRRIGVSGYPEGHPLITDKDLSASQQEKIEVLRDFGIEPMVVTQFSFESEAIIRYCKYVHSRYPDIQIKNGLPGPAKLTTLVRFAQRCGVKSSMRKMKALPVSTGLRLLQRVPPVKQAEAVGKYRLENNGNVTVHLFTFGGLEASLDWISEEIAAPSGGGDK